MELSDGLNVRVQRGIILLFIMNVLFYSLFCFNLQRNSQCVLSDEKSYTPTGLFEKCFYRIDDSFSFSVYRRYLSVS